MTRNNVFQRLTFSSQGLLSYAKSDIDVYYEIWTRILSGIVTLETDNDAKDVFAVTAFPLISKDENTLYRMNTTRALVKRRLIESKEIFQDDYSWTLKFHYDETEKETTKLVMTLLTRRNDDWYEPDFTRFMNEFTPSLERVVNNDIPGFPFDNVYDFISEINRPPDPETVNNLKVQFTAQDLKINLSKSKSKKDPKEFLLNINVRLSRLQKWKELLESQVDNHLSDEYLEYFPVKTLRKYQSLISLVKLDPKRALETQYDKKRVYLDIIRKWSDRLKKAFKYQYISKEKPFDYDAAMESSAWKSDLRNTTVMLSKVPFLDLDGPTFTPGAPKPLFGYDVVPLTSQFSVTKVMYEMLTWIKYMEDAISFAGFEMSYFGTITHHVYSRAMLPERALSDCWFGISTWARDLDASLEGSATTPASMRLSMEDILDKIAGNRDPNQMEYAPPTQAQEAADHTEEFLRTLQKLNDFSRKRSTADGMSVKEMFKYWNEEAKSFVTWWSALIKDLDVANEFERLARSRGNALISWTDLMQKAIRSYIEKSKEYGYEQSPEEMQKMRNMRDTWFRYKKALIHAETLRGLMPWPAGEAPQPMTSFGWLPREMVQNLLGTPSWMQVDPPVKESTKHLPVRKSLLLVLPRLFPGYGVKRGTGAEELVSICVKSIHPSIHTLLSCFRNILFMFACSLSSQNAFLEFAGGIEKDLNDLFGKTYPHLKITVKALHPYMTDSDGYDVFHHRAPHPSVVIIASKKQQNMTTSE